MAFAQKEMRKLETYHKNSSRSWRVKGGIERGQQKISKSGWRLKRSRKPFGLHVNDKSAALLSGRHSTFTYNLGRMQASLPGAPHFPATWQISLPTLVTDVNWRIKLTVKVEWKFEILSSKCSALRQVCQRRTGLSPENLKLAVMELNQKLFQLCRNKQVFGNYPIKP